jgi:uncharacterized repeat protein (TIGR03803 family)
MLERREQPTPLRVRRVDAGRDDGKYYGTTSSGGVDNAGTLFKITLERHAACWRALCRSGCHEHGRS